MIGKATHRAGRWVAAHPWLAAGIALYGVCLGLVFTTVSFGEERATRQFIAQVSQRNVQEPALDLRPVRTVQWPDITLRRDPFLPITQDPPQDSPKR